MLRKPESEGIPEHFGILSELLPLNVTLENDADFTAFAEQVRLSVSKLDSMGTFHRDVFYRFRSLK